MSIKTDEARAIVRAIIADGAIEQNDGQVVKQDGETVRVSQDDGAVRFDLDGMQMAFVLKSNRLYERPYEQANVVDHMQAQMDYRGQKEQVDTRQFTNQLVCECGNVRWVKNADLFQVKKCKPCTYQHRLARRKKSRQRNG